MEKMNDLRMLLQHELEDLRSAEDQIIEALPKMIEKSSNKELRKGLEKHLEITRTHVTRLEQVQEMISQEPRDGEGEEKKGFFSGLFGSGKTHCRGMEGLISEGEKTMKEDMVPEVLDAAIIACAQKVEHYEICAYGTLRAYATELNLSAIANLLELTLNEEYEADDLLTSLALGRINERAETARRRDSRPPSTLKKNKNAATKQVPVVKKGATKREAPKKGLGKPGQKKAGKSLTSKKAAPKKAVKNAPKKAVKKSTTKKPARKPGGNSGAVRSKAGRAGAKDQGRKSISKGAKKKK